jgi:hypothetical protein
MKFIFNLFLCFSVFTSSLSFSSDGFIADTPISTPSGFKYIQDITKEDTVISCDISSMQLQENKATTNSIGLYTNNFKVLY